MFSGEGNYTCGLDCRHGVLSSVCLSVCECVCVCVCVHVCVSTITQKINDLYLEIRIYCSI